MPNSHLESQKTIQPVYTTGVKIFAEVVLEKIEKDITNMDLDSIHDLLSSLRQGTVLLQDEITQRAKQA